MLLSGVLILALLAGLLRRGRLDALSQHRWRLPALPCLGLGVQIVAFLPNEGASLLARTFASTLHVMSYLLLLAFIWANRRTAWIWLIGLGLAANAIAIGVNGGFMPVAPSALEGMGTSEVAATGVYNNSVLMTGETRMTMLSDVLRTPDWFPLRRAFSVGDILVAAGAVVLVQRLMRDSPALGENR